MIVRLRERVKIWVTSPSACHEVRGAPHREIRTSGTGRISGASEAGEVGETNETHPINRRRELIERR